MNLEEISEADLPTQPIKLVFFDIDGTLLGLDGTYSQATLREIKRIQALGIHTAVASGRPYFAARYLVEELNLAEAGSFCTGAHLYRPRDNTTVAVNALSTAVCCELLAVLRSSDLHYELYTDTDYYHEHPQRRRTIIDTHAFHLRKPAISCDFDEIICRQPVIKFLAAVDNLAEQEKLFAIERQFPHLQFAYATVAAHPEWLFASIVDQSACKTQAFAVLLAHYQLNAKEVMSFGDAQSDKVFLQKAGLGIAMGNANEDVKLCANYITRAVWDDGVAYALARLIRS